MKPVANGLSIKDVLVEFSACFDSTKIVYIQIDTILLIGFNSLVSMGPHAIEGSQVPYYIPALIQV